jgi:hypothetical protein
MQALFVSKNIKNSKSVEGLHYISIQQRYSNNKR